MFKGFLGREMEEEIHVRLRATGKRIRGGRSPDDSQRAPSAPAGLASEGGRRSGIAPSSDGDRLVGEVMSSLQAMAGDVDVGCTAALGVGLAAASAGSLRLLTKVQDPFLKEGGWRRVYALLTYGFLAPHVGGGSAAIIKLVKPLLGHAEWDVRCGAVVAFGLAAAHAGLGEARRLLSEMDHLLEDSERDVRACALLAVGLMSTTAKDRSQLSPFLERLQPHLQTRPHYRLRSAEWALALAAFGQQNPQTLLPRILELAEEIRGYKNPRSVLALGVVASHLPHPEVLIPSLEELLSKKQEAHTVWRASALTYCMVAACAPDPSRYLPRVKEFLRYREEEQWWNFKQKEVDVRWGTAAGLGLLARKISRSSLLPLLTPLAQTGHKRVRKGAYWSMGLTGAFSSDPRPLLEEIEKVFAASTENWEEFMEREERDGSGVDWELGNPVYCGLAPALGLVAARHPSFRARILRLLFPLTIHPISYVREAAAWAMGLATMPLSPWDPLKFLAVSALPRLPPAAWETCFACLLLRGEQKGETKCG